jgi:hypothetical protein
MTLTLNHEPPGRQLQRPSGVRNKAAQPLAEHANGDRVGSDWCFALGIGHLHLGAPREPTGLLKGAGHSTDECE